MTTLFSLSRSKHNYMALVCTVFILQGSQVSKFKVSHCTSLVSLVCLFCFPGISDRVPDKDEGLAGRKETLLRSSTWSTSRWEATEQKALKIKLQFCRSRIYRSMMYIWLGPWAQESIELWTRKWLNKWKMPCVDHHGPAGKKIGQALVLKQQLRK